MLQREKTVTERSFSQRTPTGMFNESFADLYIKIVVVKSEGS